VRGDHSIQPVFAIFPLAEDRLPTPGQLPGDHRVPDGHRTTMAMRNRAISFGVKPASDNIASV